MGQNEKILLADDQSIVHEGITPILERDGHSVLHAYSIADVQRIADNLDNEITLALIDNRFPKNGDGERAATYVRNKRSNVKVVAFTNDDVPWAKLRIEKGQSGAEIKAAIKAL